MNVLFPIWDIIIAALLVLAAPSGFAGGCLQRNPPGSTEGDASSPCGCQTGGDSVGADCIMVNLEMGATTPWTGSRPLALKVFADSDSPLVFTPDSLYPIMGYAFKRLGNAVMSDGVTAKEVVFSHPNGEPVHFVFKEGESLGRPDPGVHVPMDERLQMVDAQGWATARDPVYWDLYENDGTVRRFLATDVTGRRGALVSVTDSRGVVTTPADMGVDLVHGPDGVRQFLTPSRLADVRVVRGGYDVAVYPIDSAPPAKGADGLYALPDVPACRFLSVRSEKNGRRALVTLRSGGAEPRRYVFDYVAGDWSLTRPNGVRELKDRAVVDSAKARLSKEVRSPSNALLSKSVMNYRWESWGYAMTNKVEGFGDTTRTTSWTYFTSGNGKGKVRSSLSPTGLLTEYAYDAENRETSVRRSGPDMMTELVTYSHASVDPSDVVPPVDSRPRTVVKTLDGVECERTYYVYSPLTNVVERVGTQGAPYGGTNALRTVTAYYPVVAGDVRSGRVRSVRREDGRLDLYDYALVTNVWTETVTHLHEQSTAPVSGRTTRDVRVSNRRGETLEQKTEAFVGGIWYTVSRNRMTYNLEGKRVRAEDLAGQVTATEWDCCHKVAEIRPDGSATAWDYDDEGRLVAASRLIPLDLTNVTWLTTCYAYDGLGRQTAAWTTNLSAHVGLPATKTRYDPLGRVLSRTDALGNATTTTYSPDGRTVSVLNPNTSTAISSRNAEGHLLSVIGTAVTSEFRTYGVLSDGTRWTRTVQGESPDSPRFTKRYENMLGQAIREERSGYRGAVLATVNAYDACGRLVRSASDSEPTTTYAYDEQGSSVATVRSVGGTGVSPVQWRRSETRLAYVLADGAVWQTQTNVTSCSDVAIAPLVTSQSLQLTGLTPATPARTRTTDIRGNVTESWTDFSDGITTARRRVPEATNIASSRSRFGVSLESVSVSAVTNRTIYDALGRIVAAIDGRGNATRTEYDSVGRRSATIDAAGNPTRYAYNRFGNLAAVTNALGNAIVYEYDLRGHKTYEGGATYPVRYTYDVFGNKTTMMTYRDESLGPDSGDVTTWFYDEASGVMTNKVYADGKGPRYDYDANGRLVKRTWARGIDTFYAYDGWGNLTNTTYSDNTPTVAIKYDALGRQVEAHDAAGVTTFAYDAFGANTNETVVGVAGTNVLERFTDEFGRDAGYALNGARQTLLKYDAGNSRLTTMQTPQGGSGALAALNGGEFRWTYLPGSDLKSSLSYPNGLTASWTYDANNQLLRVKNATSTNIISQYDYTYDAAGRRIRIGKSGSAFDFNDVVSYDYNARSELTNAVAAVDVNYRYSYQYDSIGSRKASSERGANTNYAANQLNQYTAVGDFTPAFDGDGNQSLIKTATGIWSITYNGENRPDSWKCGVTNVMMKFDRMGRRVEYTETVNGVTYAHHRFMYNEHLCIQRLNGLANNTINIEFLWDPSELVATRPLVLQKYRMCNVFYTHDGNKNIAELVFVQQQNGVAAHYNYSPFGVVTVMTNNAPEAVQDFCKCNPFQFSSEYSDKEIALTYYNQRHYDTTYGRWTSSDPAAGEKSYDYIFVSNNPLVAYDYLGLIEPCPKGFPLRYNAGKVQYRSLIDNQKFKKTNGCGAEGGSSFPNSFIYKHIVNFKDCCDAHDVCYGTCSRDKLGCDHNLGSCMRKKCRRLLFMPLAYELCIGQANIYEAAVAIAGSDAFESAQDKCCVWIDCCPEPLSIPSPQFTLSEVINGMNNFIQSP